MEILIDDSEIQSRNAKIERATNRVEALEAELKPKNPHLGDTLKAYRKLHDLDLRTVAAEIEIGAATLMRIEQGRQMDAATWLKLQRWLLGD